jgi:hypothetical protein
MTKALVLAGLGYTILPLSSFHRQMESGELSALRLRQPEISWMLSMAYRRDQRTARAITARHHPRRGRQAGGIEQMAQRAAATRGGRRSEMRPWTHRHEARAATRRRLRQDGDSLR